MFDRPISKFPLTRDPITPPLAMYILSHIQEAKIPLAGTLLTLAAKTLKEELAAIFGINSLRFDRTFISIIWTAKVHLNVYTVHEVFKSLVKLLISIFSRKGTSLHIYVDTVHERMHRK